MVSDFSSCQHLLICMASVLQLLLTQLVVLESVEVEMHPDPDDLPPLVVAT